MKSIQILGAVIFALGLLALYFGNHASNAPLEELSNSLTGRFSDQTMWYFAIGTVASIGGALLALFGNRT